MLKRERRDRHATATGRTKKPKYPEYTNFFSLGTVQPSAKSWFYVDEEPAAEEDVAKPLPIEFVQDKPSEVRSSVTPASKPSAAGPPTLRGKTRKVDVAVFSERRENRRASASMLNNLSSKLTGSGCSGPVLRTTQLKDKLLSQDVVRESLIKR